MFKNKIHIPLGGDIETMLLPKNSLKLILSDLPHFFFSFCIWSLSNVECSGFLLYNLILVSVIC